MLSICMASSPAMAEPKAEIIKKTTPYGEISYPQLSGLADKNIEDSINRGIQEEAASWTCDFEDEKGDSERMSFNAWSTVRLIDEHYFSFTISKDYYCGGPYPSAHMNIENFDVQSGVPMTITALLVPEMQGQHLSDFLLKDHVFDPDGCGKDAYIERNWDYYRTKDTIVFLPIFPHAMQACFEEFSVPIEKLKDYMWKELEEDRD